MTTRRSFILGTFVLGCALALGIKPKRPGVVYYMDGETHYLKTAPFKLRGVDGNYASVPESVYFEAKDDLDWMIERRDGRIYFRDLTVSDSPKNS